MLTTSGNGFLKKKKISAKISWDFFLWNGFLLGLIFTNNFNLKFQHYANILSALGHMVLLLGKQLNIHELHRITSLQVTTA